jgi:hypothetical protein
MPDAFWGLPADGSSAQLPKQNAAVKVQIPVTQLRESGLDWFIRLAMVYQLWRFLGGVCWSIAMALGVLGLRLDRIGDRIARRAGITMDLIAALPWWLGWAVPESWLGWTGVALLLVLGGYMLWWARYARRVLS